MERRRGWAVVTAASGTVLIGAGAFWLSFTALADLAVLALDGRQAAWYPWALLIGGALVSVIANAAHALVTAEASVPGLLAATVAAVPPLVLLASTHLTVVLIRSTRTATAPPPAAPQTEAPLPVLPAAGIAPETAAFVAAEPDDPAPQHEDEDAEASAPVTPEAGKTATAGAGGAAAGGGLVEQADRPRTRCAPLDHGPVAAPSIPARGRAVCVC